MRLRTAGCGLLVCLLLLVGGILSVEMMPGTALAQVTNFSSVTVSGDLIAGDDITAGDDVTAADDVITGNWSRMTAQTSIAVTSDGLVSPAGTYQPLTAAGAVGTSRILTTGLSTGAVLHLVNVSANTITFTDTGDLLLGGNRALGQNDTLTLVMGGDDWVELSFTNN